MSLPIRHRLFTTNNAVAAAAGSLLPYRLQRCTADEMLYGGTRVTGLAAAPPAVRITRSQELKLPTIDEERNDLGIEWRKMHILQTPNNVPLRSRYEMGRIKSADLLAKFRAEKEKGHHQFHPPSSQLSVRPPKEQLPQARPHHRHPEAPRASYSVWDPRRFQPLQSIKPYKRAGMGFSASRGGGLRAAEHEQFQERLNRKGFGEKKNMHQHPNFHGDTVGYRPRRYY